MIFIDYRCVYLVGCEAQRFLHDVLVDERSLVEFERDMSKRA